MSFLTSGCLATFAAVVGGLGTAKHTYDAYKEYKGETPGIEIEIIFPENNPQIPLPPMPGRASNLHWMNPVYLDYGGLIVQYEATAFLTIHSLHWLPVIERTYHVSKKEKEAS
jgi:hypothetical protein